MRTGCLRHLPRVHVTEPGEQLKDNVVAHEEALQAVRRVFRREKQFGDGRQRIVDEERQPAQNEDAHDVRESDRRLLLLGKLRQALADRLARFLGRERFLVHGQLMMIVADRVVRRGPVGHGRITVQLNAVILAAVDAQAHVRREIDRRVVHRLFTVALLRPRRRHRRHFHAGFERVQLLHCRTVDAYVDEDHHEQGYVEGDRRREERVEDIVGKETPVGFGLAECQTPVGDGRKRDET